MITVANHINTFRDCIGNFKGIVSLVFHAASRLVNDADWKGLYDEFEEELERQNIYGWPKVSVNRNSYRKILTVLLLKPFMKSNNVLILLLRLLYIENYKANQNCYCQNVLEYIIAPVDVTNLSLENLFDLLKKYVIYYVKVYQEESYYEYQLGNAILTYFE